MRTNFFCTNFLNTPRGPGHPGKIPGTSQLPSLETQGKQTFEGGHELFDPHPFAWKAPAPPGGLRPKKLIFVLFFLHDRARRGQQNLLSSGFETVLSETIFGPSPTNVCNFSTCDSRASNGCSWLFGALSAGKPPFL